MPIRLSESAKTNAKSVSATEEMAKSDGEASEAEDQTKDPRRCPCRACRGSARENVSHQHA
jgi:hypothetical protein